MTRGVVANTGFAITLAFMAGVVVGCPSTSSASPSWPGAATWEKVNPPPQAPPGMVCYVWSKGWAQHAYGGPECFIPTKSE